MICAPSTVTTYPFEAVIDRPGDSEMINLTVDELHTFYVIAGAETDIARELTAFAEAVGVQRVKPSAT
jgi:hypothetical protein